MSDVSQTWDYGHSLASGVGRELTNSLTGLSDGASNALQNASSSLETLRQAASAAAEDLGVQTLQSADNVLYSLPDPVRQTIQAIASPIVTVCHANFPPSTSCDALSDIQGVYS